MPDFNHKKYIFCPFDHNLFMVNKKAPWDKGAFEEGGEAGRIR
jgi:hypothetical protein